MMMRDVTMLAAGCALGACAMYLLDPESGDKRRKRMKKHAADYGGEVLETMKGKAHELQGRAEQAYADIKGDVKKATT